MLCHILPITFLIMTTDSSHTKNITNVNSDVIVTYSGHAEALDPQKPPKPVTTETTVKLLIPESFATDTTPVYEEDTEGIVFVPNDKPVFRNGDYRDDLVSVGDVMVKKTVGDVFHDKRAETEPPHEDILFISGKNNENVEKPSKKEEYHNDYEARLRKKKKEKKTPLNCSDLDCNNTLKSVCGAKMVDRQWKYRVFLNACYFRKVNCDFKYEINRYRLMPAEFCKPVGSHQSDRPFIYNPPLPILPKETPAPIVNLRRSSSSRRSLNIELDGAFCSHPCPPSCPEEYSPECAVTSTGQRKVFVNHCKLDYNSCSYGTVWHKRPLSDCVGNQKSDIRQNRAFIGWMQRVGIVDGKGRLIME